MAPWSSSSHYFTTQLRIKSYSKRLNTAQKWSFPLRISSANVIKSAVYCRFGHIYWRNSSQKLHFLCSAKFCNGEKYSVNLRIQSKHENSRIRKVVGAAEKSPDWNWLFITITIIIIIIITIIIIIVIVVVVVVVL